MNIDFINEHPSFIFSQEELYLRKVSKLFTNEGVIRTISLCIVFMSDDDLLEINKEHLNHDYYTDIITFPIEDEEAFLQADIYISIDRVMANAKEFKVSFETELLRVVLHGCLHLCGYNDHSEEEKRIMRSKEEFYLSF